MALIIKKATAEGSVEVTTASGVSKKKGLKVAAVTTHKHTANIGFSASVTKNLGNYENVKLQVSLNMPVPLDSLEMNEATKKALNDAFETVTDWVDGRMNEALEQLNNPPEDGEGGEGGEALVDKVLDGVAV